ncbi:MAG: VCBS repeat-containing protein [Polyangiales bacterium]|nr:VCBS repeat-containing protein [Myxococcales bacterium]MCB9661667.1 VCBS repeat-containing protein [Sandaracinaceae bacterium]
MQRFRHGSLFPLTRTARTARPSALSAALLLLAVPCVGCGGGETPETTGATAPVVDEPTTAVTDPNPPPAVPADPLALPADLPNGLLLVYSDFAEDDNGSFTVPQPARMEILTRRNGEWTTEVVTDRDSNVFHKAMPFTPAVGAPGILTAGGSGAFVRLWRRTAEGFTPETLWTESFGGRFDRMRDIEVGDLYGNGRPAIAVATHDQGVFAVLRQSEQGAWDVDRMDQRADTFVHEVEIGDLNHDGKLEVYTTPSEPNRLDGGAQHGEVLRYIPQDGRGSRTVVADLGNRHAKEIWVGDVDGDGTDELYVAVEALTRMNEGRLETVEPVEIRRYDANTPPDARVVVATLEDTQCRFLTVGDFDGDGKREMVAAAMRSGLWLLRPGSDPRGEWSVERIDQESGGFEHASTVADLDGDGRDELYVAADNQGELRRYVWVNNRPRRQMIHSRAEPRQRMTWNITAVPVSLLSAP